ncbi:hypothetical protein [Pseudomonas capsici]|uniref:hypothetical protein n=1 Tax=Pseudomonas capsici TaxID=2810614 RepID=UPI0021F106C9|nr:hypothetical protein [Pseudomonas capsici]MCV4281560.1 hypothetical protein [Pseudomonas capsici]
MKVLRVFLERLDVCKYKIILLFAFFTIAGCEKPPRSLNSANIPGKSEYSCSRAADLAAEVYKKSLLGSSGDNSEKEDVWVYKTRFSFRKDDRYRLINDYNQGYPVDGESEPKKGIRSYYRVPIHKIKEEYPEVITTGVSDRATYLVVRLECYPDKTGADLNQDQYDAITSWVDTDIGVRESRHYYYSLDEPLDKNIRNPDGTIPRIVCSYNETMQCSSQMIFSPGIQLTYKYPTEQRADWMRIRHFLINKLNMAIVE